jgi:hypothetical protein
MRKNRIHTFNPNQPRKGSYALNIQYNDNIANQYPKVFRDNQSAIEKESSVVQFII